MPQLPRAFRIGPQKLGPLTISARLRVAASALLLSIAGCVFGTEPRAELIQPDLEDLRVSVIDAPIGPLLRVSGVALGVVRENQAVLVSVETSAGSSTELRIPRYFCGASQICRTLHFTLKPGREMADLHDFLANLDAALVPGRIVDEISGEV